MHVVDNKAFFLVLARQNQFCPKSRSFSWRTCHCKNWRRSLQKLDKPLEQLHQSLTTKYLAKESRNETEVGTFNYNINSMLLKFKDLLGFLLYSCP